MGNALDSVPRIGREKFNERELEELSEQFDKLSTKKFGPQNTSSGFGTHIPLEIFQKRFLPTQPELSRRLYRVFDFDNDGKVNEHDFITGMAHCRSPVEAREKLIFKMFDEKRTERASVAALRQYFGNGPKPKPPPQMVKQMVCRGEWDYPKQSDKELSFKAGEYFTQIVDVDSTWLWVHNSQGGQGYVPRAFVRIFETEVEAPSTETSAPPAVDAALTGVDTLVPNSEGDCAFDQFLIAAQTTPKIKKLCDELIRFDTRGPPDQEITGPTDFKHTTHVGFNSKTGGFDVENLPAEWKRLFSQAGISDAELADPTTAALLVNVMSHEQNKNSLHKNGPVKAEPTIGTIGSDLAPPPEPPRSHEGGHLPPLSAHNLNINVPVTAPSHVEQREISARPQISPRSGQSRPLPNVPASPRTSNDGTSPAANAPPPVPQRRASKADLPLYHPTSPAQPTATKAPSTISVPPPVPQRDLPSPSDATKPATSQQFPAVPPIDLPSHTASVAAPAPPPLPARPTSATPATPATYIAAPGAAPGAAAPPPLPPGGSGGPPPPPPPPAIGAPLVSPRPPIGHEGGGLLPSASVSDLLSDIRKGRQLKKVDPDAINVAAMDDSEVTNLADVLRKAMVVRRADIVDGEQGTQAATDTNEEWDD